MQHCSLTLFHELYPTHSPVQHCSLALFHELYSTHSPVQHCSLALFHKLYPTHSPVQHCSLTLFHELYPTHSPVQHCSLNLYLELYPTHSPVQHCSLTLFHARADILTNSFVSGIPCFHRTWTCQVRSIISPLRMTQNPKSVTNGCKPDRKPPAENVEFLVGSKTSVGES